MAGDSELRRELAELKARVGIIEEFLRLLGARIPGPQPDSPGGGSKGDSSRTVVCPDGSRYMLTEEQATAMWESVRDTVGHRDNP